MQRHKEADRCGGQANVGFRPTADLLAHGYEPLGGNLNAVTSSVWTLAPVPGIPEPPALFSDTNRLWLAYMRAEDDLVAVVQFGDVIDHRLSPINDEGLGKHPYARAGLQFYSFNELSGSAESLRWAALKARHWVVSFKDNTLDVVARSADILRPGLAARSPTEALITVLQEGNR